MQAKYLLKKKNKKIISNEIDNICPPWEKVQGRFFFTLVTIYIYTVYFFQLHDVKCDRSFARSYVQNALTTIGEDPIKTGGSTNIMCNRFDIANGATRWLYIYI